MTSAEGTDTDTATARRRLWPLYAAGFTTAFGARGVAAYGLASGYLLLMIITLLGAGTVFWWSRRTARADVG